MAKTDDTLTRALHLEILRPVLWIDRGKETEVSWAEISPRLRAIRYFTNRLINAAVLAAIQADRVNRTLPPDDPRKLSPHTATYQAIAPELEDCRRWAKKKLDEAKPAQDARIESRKQKHAALEGCSKTATKKREKLEKEIVELDKGIQGAEWDIQSLSEQANLKLPSAIQRAIGNDGHAAFQRWRKAPNTRIPSAKQGAPIPLPGSDCELLVIKGKVYLDAKLASEGRVRFAVKLGQGQQWAVARAISSGETPHGALKLIYSKKERKWFGKIAYTVPRPEPAAQCDPEHILILHRGYYNLLTLLSTTGHFSKIDGRKLLAAKEKLRARRTDVKSIGRHERGSGAKGHGRGRYYALSDSLQDKEANMVKTACQRHAARVAQLAVAWGCGRVAIENYGGMPESDARYTRREIPHPPYFQLKTAIAHALEKAGITLDDYPCYYISQTCPRCGNADASQANHRHQLFRCNECTYERDLDFVAAWHGLIAKNGRAGDVWEARHAEHKRAAKGLVTERDGKDDEQEATRKTPRRNHSEAARPQGRGRVRKDSVLAVPGGGAE